MGEAHFEFRRLGERLGMMLWDEYGIVAEAAFALRDTGNRTLTADPEGTNAPRSSGSGKCNTCLEIGTASAGAT